MTSNLDQNLKILKEKIDIIKSFHNLTETVHRDLLLEKNANDELANKMRAYKPIESEIITFNVGGQSCSTLKSTITKKIKKKQNDIDNLSLTEQYYGPSLLEGLVNGFGNACLDKYGAIFIDRDPTNFKHILNYLRNVETDKEYILPVADADIESLHKDAEYYEIGGLIDIAKNYLQLGSLIINSNQLSKFIEICEFSDENKWKLLYRGSVDGFTSTAFHSKCNGYPSTLTIIKSSSENVFGGYTSVAWDSSGSYKDDKGAFLFSFKNRKNKPLKLTYKMAGNGIYCNSANGPTFGAGHDLYVTNQSNLNNSSSSNLGTSFNCPFTSGTTEAKECLAGSYNFTVKEIEVFHKIS